MRDKLVGLLKIDRQDLKLFYKNIMVKDNEYAKTFVQLGIDKEDNKDITF